MKTPDLKSVSMSKRLTLALVLVMTLISVLVATSFYLFTSSKLEQTFNREVEQIFSYLDGAIAPALWSYDFETTAQIAETMLRDDLVIGVTVRGDKQKSVFSSGEQNGSKTLVRTQPILFQNRVVGELEVFFSRDSLSQTLNGILWVSLSLWLLAVLSLTALIHLFIHKYFEGPLASFTELAQSYNQYPQELKTDTISFTEFQPIEDVVKSLAENILKQLAELRTSEEKFRVLFEQAAVGVAQVVSRTGQFVMINQKYCDIVGYSRKVMEELTFDQITHPDDLQVDLDKMKRLMAGEIENYTIEKRYFHKNGSLVWVELTVSPMWMPGEKPDFHVAVVRDITGRKDAENKLQVLRNAIDQTAEMVVITDVEGLVEYVNPAFTRITGFSMDEVFAGKINILNSGKQSESFYREMWTAIKSGKIWKGNLINRRKSGEFYDEEMTISPIQDDKGVITHFVAIKADVSEEKKLQQQLIHTEKLSTVGTFVSGVAHELNNPLTSVIGYAEMLLEEENVPEDVKRQLNIIFSQSKRTVEIVKNLLKFARKESEEMKPLTAYEIGEMLDGVIQLHSYRLKADSIQIVTDFSRSLSSIYGNVGNLQQVFMNIIVNAHHAIQDSQKKGVITCKTSVDQSQIVITFENDGPTMPEEIITKIFDPFFTTKEAGKGTGLGMFISHQIIENHNGTIKVENLGDSGVCFTITLPLRISENDESPPLMKQQVSIKGLKVLIIDDEEPIREFLSTILLNEGCFCVAAKDGEMGLRHLQESHFDIVISDLKMQKMDGMEVAKWLHDHKPEQLKKFILLTGVIDKSVEDFCEKYQCTWLIKPVLKGQLLEQIHATLNQEK